MLMRHIYLSLLAVAAMSCRTPQTVTTVETRTDSVYIDRLVPYPLPTDSATVRALMECDESGRVTLRQLDIMTTKNVALQLTVDSLGELLADMRVKPDTLYLPSKEVYVDRRVEVPVTVEKALTRWERIKQEAGGWAIGAASGAVIALVAWLLRRLLKK